MAKAIAKKRKRRKTPLHPVLQAALDCFLAAEKRKLDYRKLRPANRGRSETHAAMAQDPERAVARRLRRISRSACPQFSLSLRDRLLLDFWIGPAARAKR
jgi:hypothetical protein